MRKVRFIRDHGSFAKDSCRVIMGEDSEYYHIQLNLHSTESIELDKGYNGDLFQVIERS